MVDRITLAREHYVQLDGQWQIVLPGSVIDVPSASKFASTHQGTGANATLIGTGTLGAHGKATSVSNIRTR